MNHPTPDEEIEALLGRLSPAPPDEALMTRLQAARPGPSKIIRFLKWSPLAVAAAVAFAFLLRADPAAKVPAETTTAAVPENSERVPLESRQHLMEVADLGVVSSGDQEKPYRLIRATWVDEVLYGSKSGKAPVKESRLREEVLPVALTTY